MSEQPPIPDLKPVRPIDYAAPEPAAHHGIRYRARRWYRDRVTRENIISNLKTLAWVIPLTFLIWVYAEREQITTKPGEPVPFELVSLDPNRIVSLVDPKQDKNLIVDLQGPQARVDEALERIRGGQNGTPNGIRLEVNSSLTPNKEHEINALELLRQQKIFSDYGVSVVRCQPAWLLVRIDPIVERDARIVPPPDVTNIEPSSSFDPPVVRVRGPKSKLDDAAQQNGKQLVVYAEIPQDVQKSAGHHELSNVAVEWPANLQDDRVSIVGTPAIKATLDVRPADVTGKIDSMPVVLEMPNAVIDNIQSGKWKVHFQTYLTNVHVVGPKEIIDQINNPDFAKRPTASIEVTPDDLGEARQKQVKYDLPKGVSVAKEDQNRAVDFRLSSGTAAE
jgi:hypothetical protein